MNIYSSRRRYDVFMIDEPEVHLNWHLEEKLFEFLDDLCEEHHRQMIVVTHSRIIFKQRFFPKTQFLFWNDAGTVSIGRNVTPEQRRRIAGDAIEIVRLGAFTKPTLFVEDSAHVTIIEELASLLAADVLISECGNKANLRSLYRLSLLDDGGWTNSYFVEDGDNEGNPHPRDGRFIHLDKYCMETYLLDVSAASAACGLSEEQVRQRILDALVANKEKVFRRGRFLEFLLEQIRPEHLTPTNLAQLDASEIIHTFLTSIGKDVRQYIRAYLSHCRESGRLKDVLPLQLVELLERLHAEAEAATAN